MQSLVMMDIRFAEHDIGDLKVLVKVRNRQTCKIIKKIPCSILINKTC